MPQQPQTSTAKRPGRLRIIVAYGVTVALLIIAWFFPEARLWGLNFAAYLPSWAGVILVAPLIAAPYIADVIGRRQQPTSATGGRFVGVTVALSVIAGFVFYLFRTQTHFLGDGYQILSLLSQEQPFLKPVEYGEAAVHLFAGKLLGGTEQETLTSYRIVSIGAGMIAVALTGVLATRLFKATVDRWLYTLGIVTAGSTLLFFGYVENYSLLTLATLTTAVIGTLILDGRLSRGWIALPTAAAIFFHLLGIVLVPAVLYVLLHDSPPSRWFARQARATRWFTAAVVAVIVIVGATMVYTGNLFLRLAVLSPWSHRWSIPGYLLFSPRHLIDLANLLLMLLPGILILAASLPTKDRPRLFGTPSRRYLWIMSLTAVLVAFILDPKLGMPRDWDLFAFVAIPASLLLYRLILESSRPWRRHAVILSIAVSVVVLAARVAVLATPEASVQYAAHVRDLDPIKTRNLWYVMIDYYRDTGDTTQAQDLRHHWSRRFPELKMNEQAYRAYYQGDMQRAIQLSKLIIQRNPTYADAWINAGASYHSLGKLDSAEYYLEIAGGLSPHTPSIYVNLAAVMIEKGSLSRAESLLHDAMSIDSTISAAYYQLARVHASRGQTARYLHYLDRATRKNGAGPRMARELVVASIEADRIRKARQALERAIELGLDSSSVSVLLSQYPRLRQ